MAGADRGADEMPRGFAADREPVHRRRIEGGEGERGAQRFGEDPAECVGGGSRPDGRDAHPRERGRQRSRRPGKTSGRFEVGGGVDVGDTRQRQLDCLVGDHRAHRFARGGERLPQGVGPPYPDEILAPALVVDGQRDRCLGCAARPRERDQVRGGEEGQIGGEDCHGAIVGKVVERGEAGAQRRHRTGERRVLAGRPDVGGQVALRTHDDDPVRVGHGGQGHVDQPPTADEARRLVGAAHPPGLPAGQDDRVEVHRLTVSVAPGVRRQ